MNHILFILFIIIVFCADSCRSDQVECKQIVSFEFIESYKEKKCYWQISPTDDKFIKSLGSTIPFELYNNMYVYYGSCTNDPVLGYMPKLDIFDILRHHGLKFKFVDDALAIQDKLKNKSPIEIKVNCDSLPTYDGTIAQTLFIVFIAIFSTIIFAIASVTVFNNACHPDDSTCCPNSSYTNI